MESARLFLALDLEEQVLTRLRDVVQALDPVCDGARWVKPEAMHLTIKFFGVMPLSEVPGIGTGVSRVLERRTAFSGEVCGIGGFPSFERPRVLWAGMRDEEMHIQSFGEELLEELETQGYGAEDRRFVPHITLARFKRRAPLNLTAVSRILPDYGTHSFGETFFDRVVLYSSELTPDGPIYRVVNSWDLKS
jgi:2'-5' RNA ligase